jgi:hypothetical protein
METIITNNNGTWKKETHGTKSRRKRKYSLGCGASMQQHGEELLKKKGVAVVGWAYLEGDSVARVHRM